MEAHMFKVENASSQDLEEVFAFLVQCDLAEFGEEDSSRDDLEELWSEIDPQRDAFLVRSESGGLVGYACVSGASRGLQMDVYVDPASSPAGVEDDLMRVFVERARGIFAGGTNGQEALLTGYASVSNPRNLSLYDRWGFKEVKRHYNMAIRLAGEIPAPQWPARYSVSPFDPKDEYELYTFIEEAFSRPDRTPSTFEFWRNLLLRGGRYDPALFLVLRTGGRIAGAALSYDEDAGGWVRQLAVAPDQHGRGLGSLLLRQLFSEFARRGKQRAALAVSAENANALRVYENAGMQRVREYIEYQIDLL